MDRKIRQLHGSLQDSSDEEPPFKDFTKVLKDTCKKSGSINRLSELIKTLWQQKEPLDQLKDEMDTYDPPQNYQKLAIKYCNEEIWNGYLQNKHRNVDLKIQKVQKTINKGGIILVQVADSLINGVTLCQAAGYSKIKFQMSGTQTNAAYSYRVPKI